MKETLKVQVFIRTWRGLEANGEHVVVLILKICSITNIGRVRGQGVRVGFRKNEGGQG